METPYCIPRDLRLVANFTRTGNQYKKNQIGTELDAKIKHAWKQKKPLYHESMISQLHYFL